MAVLIRQAKVIGISSPFHNQKVDIFIDKGIIHSIGKKLDMTADTVIESDDDLYVSNGWVDIFADYREPGFEQKETIESGLNTAAKGGFTDVLTLPNTHPAVSTKSIVQYLLNRAAGHIVRLHPLGSVSKDIEGKVLAEMLDMHAHGAIAFTDGWKPVQSANLLLKALEYAKAFKGTIIQIPQDDSLASGGLMHEGPVSTSLGMPGIPVIAETLMLHRDIELLRYTGSKLHITGISSAKAVNMIREAKDEGLHITCSVSPYHLALNDEVMRTYDSVYKVAPPIRSEKDRLALAEGLKDGTIDCIASHHRPQEWDAKTKEFEYASDGINAQEIAFAITYNAVKDLVPLERIINALSARPREIFGLDNHSIDKNIPANMSIFSLNAATRKQSLQSLSQNNPFIGATLQGAVIGIINHDKISLA